MKTRFGFIDPGRSCAVFDSNVRDYDWAKSVESHVDNTEVTQRLKNFEHCNAYSLKLLGEYNGGTSVQHPIDRMKMYAELTGNCKNYEIKSS